MQTDLFIVCLFLTKVRCVREGSGAADAGGAAVSLKFGRRRLNLGCGGKSGALMGRAKW